MPKPSETGYIEIYNQLLLGKSLPLQFSSKQEAASLRAALHTHHTRQQRQFSDVGLDLVQGRITFVCTDTKTNKYKVQILMGETKKPRKTYVVLGEDEVAEGEEAQL